MLRPWLSVAVKAAISAALIWWLLDRVDFRPVLGRLAQIEPLWLIPVAIAMIVQIAIAAERWRLVARAIGVAFRWAVWLRILVIGVFFNQTLPSAIGGDAVRVWIISREGVGLGKSVNVVLCDRVVALFTLILVVTATLPVFYGLVADQAARIGITTLCVGGLGGFAVALLGGESIARMLRRWRYTRPFGDLASDFRMAVLSRETAGAILGLSLVVHLLTVTLIFLLARAFGAEMGFLACLVLVPPVVLAMMVPITIAGWGVREGAMAVAFGFVGVPPADAIAVSVAFGLSNILTGIPGGILWLTGGRRELAAARAAAQPTAGHQPSRRPPS